MMFVDYGNDEIVKVKDLLLLDEFDSDVREMPAMVKKILFFQFSFILKKFFNKGPPNTPQGRGFDWGRDGRFVGEVFGFFDALCKNFCFVLEHF
jgi:hypothetical protein